MSAPATLSYRAARPEVGRQRSSATPVCLRSGDARDSSALHALSSANVDRGWLLPRAFEELQGHAHRFLVMTCGDDLVGCAELAPLGDRVAEIRSLVVDAEHRGRGLASRLVRTLRRRALTAGYERLCAFADDPRPFLGWGFSIVSRDTISEKIATNCSTCRHFRDCTQYGLVLALRHGRPRTRRVS